VGDSMAERGVERERVGLGDGGGSLGGVCLIFTILFSNNSSKNKEKEIAGTEIVLGRTT